MKDLSQRLSLLVLLASTSLIACSSTPGPAPASSPSPSASITASGMNWWERDPVFLSKDAIDFTKAVPAPPKKGSKEDQKELAEVLRLQESRTKEECARAKEEEFPTLGSLFGPQYGILTQEEVTRWTPFIESVSTDAEYMNKNVKVYWKRERPFVADTRVKPCIEGYPSNSYPSGHGTISSVIALVLSDLDPSRKAAFQMRAKEIAFNRVIAGVHYRSDVEVGTRFGHKVYALLAKNKAYQQELKEQKALKPQSELSPQKAQSEE